MKVLVIGGGGREHALVWKVAQSSLVEAVYAAPGNPGTAAEPKTTNVAIAADDLSALVSFARDNQVGLTIVGPEAPLAAGVVDAFEAAGLRCFGPTQAAARLEASKSFSKAFLCRHGIPTGAYQSFTELDAAQDYIRTQGAPLVVKADGLAAGKGVVIAHTEAEALAAVEQCLCDSAFGDAGRRVVIEEFLLGEEASFMVMVDGQQILPFASSQDHKARDNGDQGPNTGGMGAYSPAPVVTPELHERVMREVIEPTVAGLAAEGTPYRGFLYAGLMIDEQGVPQVLEYNCRLGDPETQPILMRLESDLVALCDAALSGTLDQCQTKWSQQTALGVVMAAPGYPGSYRKGDPISGIDAAERTGAKVFQAGTGIADGQLVSAGGRVLCVTAMGDTVAAAQAGAYRAVAEINWDGAGYRTDIGYRAVAREEQRD
ncbi:MAG: phosphoribosylamine--glycine ligase [Gammaproteobacteria bacterium]|nr:phosphoribosylamine--glycine ligase [Gammaproteobacteria bacterium]